MQKNIIGYYGRVVYLYYRVLITCVRVCVSVSLFSYLTFKLILINNGETMDQLGGQWSSGLVVDSQFLLVTRL